MLSPWARHFILCLVLVQPRKTVVIGSPKPQAHEADSGVRGPSVRLSNFATFLSNYWVD